MVGLELRGGVERGVRGGVRRVRLVECGAVAAAAVRSVWQRCQIYRGARDIWSRPRVHDAPRDVDEVFDDLFDEKVPNVSQSDWAVAVHPEGVKRGGCGKVPVIVVNPSGWAI